MTTGQIAYTIPGTYSFVCPIGITSVSVVCIGGGGQGGNSTGLDSPGGGGGGLGYKNNIPVTAGQYYTVVVGESESAFKVLSDNGVDGSDSYFISKTTVAGFGGKGGQTGGNAGVGGTYFGDGGGNGGAGGAANSLQGGGGGAGGYSGNGGDGLSSASGSSGAGTGGAGGGGYKAGGGGVGLLGEGSSGASASSGTIGNAGSGGISATISTASFPYVNFSGVATNYTYSNPFTYGGAYGGGGCSAWANGNGGSGAVRIIWGEGREFPSTNTGDVGIGTTSNTLFITISDGEALQHPIYESNFKEAFPSVDAENLNPDQYSIFQRVNPTCSTPYEKNKVVGYATSEPITILTLNDTVTIVECPPYTMIRGATSGAVGYIVPKISIDTNIDDPNLYISDKLQLQKCSGSFIISEQIGFHAKREGFEHAGVPERRITNIGVGVTSIDLTGNYRFYYDVWTHDIMTDSEKTTKENQYKTEWNTRVGTSLSSWIFEQTGCSYVPPTLPPTSAKIGIQTNINLYDKVTGEYLGIGTADAYIPMPQYCWDEAAYQADNTQGWVI